MSGYVYIMASKPNGTLYIGVTNDLIRRVWERRQGVADGFTKTYSVKHLVHYETYDTVPDAIQREKNLKHWIRAWKIDLIEAHNPDWDDLWWVIARG